MLNVEMMAATAVRSVMSKQKILSMLRDSSIVVRLDRSEQSTQMAMVELVVVVVVVFV